MRSPPPSKVARASQLITSAKGRRLLRRRVTNLVVPIGIRKTWDYRQERRLLRTNGGSAPSQETSVLFFTVHKCASTYVRKALRHLTAERIDLVPVNFAAFYHNTEAVDTYSQIQQHSDRIFRPKGYLYAPLRHPVDVPKVDDYRIIVMLRDPRDVLTSLYYSLAISHGLPPNRERKRDFLDMRAEVQQQDIDTFVKEYLPLFQERYEGFLRITREHDCTFIRYEDMITDFEPWARQLGSGLGIDLSDTDIEYLRELGGFDRPVEENVSKHIRQRTPGDHTRKLQAETITFLNEKLGPVLEGFGYI